MPHVGGGSGDDLASSDEIKVFKDEGEDEQKESDENLTDEKSSLVTEGETEKSHLPCQSYSSGKNVSRSDSSPEPGKSFDPSHSIGYMVSPYNHANGTLGSVVGKGAGGMVRPGTGGPVPHHSASPLPFMVYGGDAFAQPPPAHMGIPPVHIDPKTGIPLVAFQSLTWKDMLEQQGIPRPPMYPLGPPGQYPHHLFSPEFAPQLQWPLFPRHPPSMYPMGSTAGFRGPYPSGLSAAAAAAAAVSAAGLPRFPPPGLLPHHIPHPHHHHHHHHHHPHLHPPHPGMPTSPSASASAIITPGPKQEVLLHLQQNCRHPSSYSIDQKPLLKLSSPDNAANHATNTNTTTVAANNNNNNATSPGVVHQSHNHHHPMSGGRPPSEKHSLKNMNHIKKPLNAFMLYMKEMRAKVVAECTLKESAAINQILGRRWHSLSRDEQAKYYEMARKERQLHMQLYPGWSARDNYALNTKKKKRKRDKLHDGDGNNPKKCRARYGLDQQSNWCKPCRRKKKCIRYMDGMTESGGDDNMGSVESLEVPTPDSLKSHSDQDSDPLNTSSELSLSSPACSLPSVPSDLLDSKPPSALSLDNGLLPHHPLSIHHLSQSVVLSSSSHPDSSETDLPQLPTPPSTDSSTSTAPTLLTVT